MQAYPVYIRKSRKLVLQQNDVGVVDAAVIAVSCGLLEFEPCLTGVALVLGGVGRNGDLQRELESGAPVSK